MRINWKNAEVVLCVVLLIQILVMLIDLDTKNRIVKASVELRETIADAGKRIQGATVKRANSDSDHNGRFPGRLVDNGTPRMATSSSMDEGPGDDESFTSPLDER